MCISNTEPRPWLRWPIRTSPLPRVRRSACNWWRLSTSTLPVNVSSHTMGYPAVSLDPAMLRALVVAAAEQIIASNAELTALDQAIGDGDHGANMKRGFEAILSKLDAIAAQPPGEA